LKIVTNSYKPELQIIRRKLDNGLDTIIIPVKSAPVVSLNLTYKVGSKSEKVGSSGFAHLFEHLMFEGTRNIPKGGFDRHCSSAGGTNNAYTTYDQTSYTMTLPSNQFELGLWLESDRLFNFAITQEAFDNQRNVVIEEIRQTVENQPYGRWREVLARSAFSPECSYSWEVHGKIEDLENSNIENAIEFYNTHYMPSNACLVICGDIVPEDASSLIDKYFSEMGNGKRLVKGSSFISEHIIYGAEDGYTDAVPHRGIFISFHTGGFNSSDIFKADLLANIAGDGRSSRLYRSLIYDKQIASSAAAFSDRREDSSLLTFYAIASEEDTSLSQLKDALTDELMDIVNSPITEEELFKACNQITTGLAYEMQFTSGLADMAAHHAVFHNAPEMILGLMDRYRNIDVTSINDFAKRVIDPNHAVIVNVDTIPG
jgi:predicted Zn-dependent peptidase